MKLNILILGGRRQGASFELNIIENKTNENIFILEDESIEICAYSERFHQKISLLLHENEVEPTLIERVAEGWCYKWLPKRLGRTSYECFFHNYFGIAELAVEVKNDERIDLFNFQQLEILAKKINADRVEKMLTYIAKIDSEALCSFFRVTRRKAGYKNGDTPAEILLEQIESLVEVISTLIRKITLRPIYKLTNYERYVYPNDSTNVNDLTLSWLCSNTDELFEADSFENAILEFNDDFYSARKLIEYQAVADTDVYENQILHGFVITLIQTTSLLLSGFRNPEKNAHKVNGSPMGYVSFFSQIQKFQKSINARKVLKCNAILSSLHSLKKIMADYIPSKKYISGIPIFTMKAKKDPLYLSVFKKIVDWYRFGKPDWSVQEELLSIQSIPKLFEYYSLFYMREILAQHIGSKSVPISVNESVSFVFDLNNGVNLSLIYEPKYWMAKHPMADLRNLVNSEGWTVYNRKITPRSSVGKLSNRCPDFVVQICANNGISKYIILDAKYTSTDKSFMDYLPELTLKYLHGLHVVSNVNNSIAGMMILNPDDTPLVRDFHSNAFDIYSDKPAMPFLICASITPGEEFTNDSSFRSALLRMVSITEKMIGADNDNQQLASMLTA